MSCPKPKARRTSARTSSSLKGIAFAQRQMPVPGAASNHLFDQANTGVSGSTQSTGHTKATTNVNTVVFPSSQTSGNLSQLMRRCRSATSIRGKVAEAAVNECHGSMGKHALHTHIHCFNLDAERPPPRLKLSKAGLHSFKAKRDPIQGPNHSTTTRREDRTLKHRTELAAAQLEAEFISRLRQIDSLQLPKKRSIRLQVARDILDEIVLLDTTFGSMLGVIRDIFNDVLKYDEPSYPSVDGEFGEASQQ
ncbi:hypothetical protein, variant [Aphanomyces invadans]|uniref:Uncharacterized protein n=1 Tax=Aphanomyces invadans TaxID=157072 RepID=A0A024ULC7_9STRA|nr:hypothetical protein, variant [Aphanomyces invadans]ETW06672.1 hypothetical protein, variant [Aphanomyces invadans]|eukprot:XP_008864747.1 hypothetical protein, variant [Aphanomyces invadans]